QSSSRAIETSPAPLWPSRALRASFHWSSFVPPRRGGSRPSRFCVPLSQSLSLLIASRLRRRASSKDLHPGHEPRHVAGGLDATSHQSLSGQAPMKFLLSKPLLT